MQQDADDRLPAQDRLRVRIFQLADHAASSPDGKLYINGAGVHGLNMPNLPGPILSPLSVVIRFHIPYLDATEPHRLRLRMLDEEMQPIGPDPIVEIADLELGRAPGTRPGDENAANLIIGLTGYPIQRNIEREIRLRIYLEVDGSELDSLPFKIIRLQPTTAAQGAL